MFHPKDIRCVYLQETDKGTEEFRTQFKNCNAWDFHSLQREKGRMRGLIDAVRWRGTAALPQEGITGSGIEMFGKPSPSAGSGGG